MKWLDGRDVAGFIQGRHVAIVRGLQPGPRLAIVRQGASAATDAYLRVKQRYGDDIGAAVDVYTETPEAVLDRIAALNADPYVTGLIVQLPFADAPELEEQAVAAVSPAKDVDGLVSGSPFEAATPKAILWLLAAYNIDVKGQHVAVVGQGRLVGKPLADRLEASNSTIVRIDEHTPDLASALAKATIIITATGKTGLITTEMVPDGAVVVDAGAPKSDLDPAVLDRTDLKITPNPGGVGPMTVAALFDNLLIAAQKS